MQAVDVLTDLFDKKILAILNTIINDKTGGMYLGEISKAANVPNPTTFRIINKLVKLELFEEIKIKKLKLYKFKRTGKSDFLYKMFKKDVQVLKIFISKVKDMSGLQAIVLHGEEAKDRANILLIGENIDSGKIKEICAKIKEDHNFTISPLTLTAEQYDSMSKMGLYSGKKNILFEKKQ
ncbi:helix-turn-helix domain-containing protein [Candidatus Woesearchaeota archaeon]|nr:helix-turn-helix domain-containing protein [Candidatus Woesearchaeota archaeon]